MEEEADDPANDLDLQLRDSVTAFLEKKVRRTPCYPPYILGKCSLARPAYRWNNSSLKRELNGKH